jgi:hypothetical protein
MCGGYYQPRVWFVMGVTRCALWMGTAHTGMLLVCLCEEIIDISDNEDKNVSPMDKGKGRALN